MVAPPLTPPALIDSPTLYTRAEYKDIFLPVPPTPKTETDAPAPSGE